MTVPPRRKRKKKNGDKSPDKKGSSALCPAKNVIDSDSDNSSNCSDSESEASRGTGTGRGSGRKSEEKEPTGEQASRGTGTGRGSGRKSEEKEPTGEQASRGTGTGRGSGRKSEEKEPTGEQASRGEMGDVFHVGDAIKNCHNLHGKITEVNVDGTFNVEYNDGQWDKNLSFEQLRKVVPNRKRRRASDPYFYEEIAEDDVNYNEWYKGASVGGHNIICETKRTRRQVKSLK